MDELIKALRHCGNGKRCNECPMGNPSSECFKMLRDAADAIERLQAEVPAWISVEERLPEKSGQYLTYDEFGWFNAYSYSIIHKQWNTQD